MRRDGPDYYNEIEPYAAQWLRNLIDAGHLPDGVVDTRSILDVRPDDLRGFRRCHFFAGIGVWALALERAGWPADWPVWTGSCPCQPFSAAGRGAGFADQRHLWPYWHHLIRECCPAVVFGEQVASKDADPWIDLVQDDLEALGYAVGALPFPAAGVGAPQPRERAFWVAGALGDRWEEGRLSASKRLQALGRSQADQSGHAGAASFLADLPGFGWQQERQDFGGGSAGDPAQGIATGSGASRGPVNGFWAAADWIECCDPGGARWRPVEPGSFPLAHGVANRVGRLRAYGNAITEPAAREFISAYLDARAA